MKAKTIEGLKLVRKGLDMIIESVEEKEIGQTPYENLPEKAETNTAEKVKTEAPEQTTFTAEQLDSMTYNDLKKLAKELGISAVGARADITARILGEETTKEDVAVDVSDAPDEEPTGDEVADRVREAVAEMSVEDIADILADVGVSAKGKREALIEKLIKAVKDGLISLDDDDEEESEAEDLSEEADEVPVSNGEAESEDDDEEEDNVNDFDNPDMTKERKTAIKAYEAQVKEQYKNKELVANDMREFLAEFHNMSISDLDEYSDEDILDFYIDASARFISDDGEIVEEEAYMLNGQPACCGHFLEYNEEESKYHCSICDGNYEAE